ncbi:MAG: response regulator receiver protein [uncultured bacterium]|nr:MAG: response regulator receiver protein [uncultured bacterium]
MKNTILIVDDDELTLHFIETVLSNKNYVFFKALDSNAALDILKDNHENIKVIIADHIMPGILGGELLQIVKTQYPQIVRMVCTAYDSVANILDLLNKGEIFRYITKPIKDIELISFTLQALEYYDSTQEKYKLLNEISTIDKILEKTNIVLNASKQHKGFDYFEFSGIFDSCDMPIIICQKETQRVFCNRALLQIMNLNINWFDLEKFPNVSIRNKLISMIQSNSIFQNDFILLDSQYYNLNLNVADFNDDKFYFIGINKMEF